GDPGFGVELDVGLHAVTFGDSAGGAVGCADADNEPPAHARDPAAPGVPVDRDGNLRPLTGPQSGDDLSRDLDPGGITGPFDRRREPHVRTPFRVVTASHVRYAVSGPHATPDGRCRR